SGILRAAGVATTVIGSATVSRRAITARSASASRWCPPRQSRGSGGGNSSTPAPKTLRSLVQRRAPARSAATTITGLGRARGAAARAGAGGGRGVGGSGRGRRRGGRLLPRRNFSPALRLPATLSASRPERFTVPQRWRRTGERGGGGGRGPGYHAARVRLSHSSGLHPGA